MTGHFRTPFGERIFQNKYAHEGCETWPELADVLVEDVCRKVLSSNEKGLLKQFITDMKFIPGGRYLYYAGRKLKYFNNCYLLISQEDSREDWAATSWKHESCLMTGGGTGNDYSVYRARGTRLGRTGGVASGPIPKAHMTNEQGRQVMQGGHRRSAMYASLMVDHGDAMDFIHAKDWHKMMIPGTDLSLWDIKQRDFNFAAPLDMTNISLNYNTDWLMKSERTGDTGEVFNEAVKQALMTGEPGWSFNFFEKEFETGRNACTEVTTDTDNDVCNLGSVNLANINNLDELRSVVWLASRFLYCGTLVADLPYEAIKVVREKNRRLGLGLMGVHEWLIKRGFRYEAVPELHEWLGEYRDVSEDAADDLADRLGLARPCAYRAIAPTGTIGILAGTTTGIEPLFSVAYKRRYLQNGSTWAYEYVVDGAAQVMIDYYDVDPDKIESALDLAADPERRIKFQYEVQKYVDMSISSTLNIPAWGTELNNESHVKGFGKLVAKYASGLRGLTVYPDGARGGQPLTSVPYWEAKDKVGQQFTEEWTDVCELRGGGTCGV